MAPTTAPRISNPSPSFAQLTYDLPHHHIFAAQFYPTSSGRPKDEILVCGHETGLTVLWRAPAREPPAAKKKGKSYASAAVDDHTVVDEGRPEDVQVNGREFASSHTIYLGTPVHAISFVPLSLVIPKPLFEDEQKHQNEPHSLARTLLAKNIVIAATCGDRTIKLVTLPLEPADDLQNRETALTVGGGLSDLRLAHTTISLTVLPAETAEDDFEDSEFETSVRRREDEDLVIASASTNTDDLLITRLNVYPAPRSSPNQPVVKLASAPYRCHLYSATSSLAFNPSPVSRTRRNQLLVADGVAVRIYSVQTHTWVASLHNPFSATTNRRKRVLAAEWCVSGRGVIVLLEDGEWGLWDLEQLLSGRSGATGWLIGGAVGETWTRSKRQRISTDEEGELGRSPRSPPGSVSSASTRWVRAPAVRDVGRHGSVSVRPRTGSSELLASTVLANTNAGLSSAVQDETIALQYGDHILVIPSLWMFLRSEQMAAVRRGAKRVRGEEMRASGEKEVVALDGVRDWGCGVGKVDVLDEGRVCVGLGARVGVLEFAQKEPEKAMERETESKKRITFA